MRRGLASKRMRRKTGGEVARAEQRRGRAPDDGPTPKRTKRTYARGEEGREGGKGEEKDFAGPESGDCGDEDIIDDSMSELAESGEEEDVE